MSSAVLVRWFGNNSSWDGAEEFVALNKIKQINGEKVRSKAVPNPGDTVLVYWWSGRRKYWKGEVLMPITADDDDDVPLAHVRASISTANITNTTTTPSLNATATPSSLNAATKLSSRKRKAKGDVGGASGKKSTSGVNFLQTSQLAPESESESDSTNEFTPHFSISDQPHPSPAVSHAYMYPPTATPSLTSYLPNPSVLNTSSNIFPSSSTTIHSIHQSTSPPLHQLPTLQPDFFTILDQSTLFPLNQIPLYPSTLDTQPALFDTPTTPLHLLETMIREGMDKLKQSLLEAISNSGAAAAHTTPSPLQHHPSPLQHHPSPLQHHPSPESQTAPQQLRPMMDVVRDPKWKKLSGRKGAASLTCQLALESAFGREVMARSTVTGRSGKPALDSAKLREIKAAVKSIYYPLEDGEEFEAVWLQCRNALKHKCKKLRKNYRS